MLKIILLFAFIKLACQFKVFWNVPTAICRKHNVTFDLAQYNITQNTNDNFVGDKISILYNPGAFPYFDENGTPRNGGIPQNANVMMHIIKFILELEQKIPNASYDGIVVLDFEAYEPTYLTWRKIYRLESLKWSNHNLSFAQQSFSTSSELLFKSLLMIGKLMRPFATFGYYHFPYCRNYNHLGICSDKQKEANARMSWVFSAMESLFPAIYISRNSHTDRQRLELEVHTRINEAFRVRMSGRFDQSIFPYFRINYVDTPEEYISEEDLKATLGTTRLLDTDGVIIWGSSADLITVEHCHMLKNYVESQFGPFVRELMRSAYP